MERVNWGVLVLPYSTEFDLQTKRIAIDILAGPSLVWAALNEICLFLLDINYYYFV